jgi:hypothetical protein
MTWRATGPKLYIQPSLNLRTVARSQRSPNSKFNLGVTLKLSLMNGAMTCWVA